MTPPPHGEVDPLSVVNDLIKQGQFDEALVAAAVVRRESEDPLQLGWARYFEIISYYRSKRWKEGARYVEAMQKPDKVFAMTTKNSAYVHSLAAEMARGAGEHALVGPFMMRALRFRCQASDLEGAGMAVHTAGVLMSEPAFATWKEEARAWASENGCVVEGL